MRHVATGASVDDGRSWQVTDPQVDGGAGPASTPVLARFSSAVAPTLGAVIVWIDNRTGTKVNGDPYRRRYGR